MRNLLRSLTESLFDKDVKSIGTLPSMICLITSKYGSTVQPFPRTATGNQLSKIKFVTGR